MLERASLSDAVEASIAESDVMTSPARRAGVRKRFDVMLNGVKSVRAALEDSMPR
ncbi:MULTISPECIES: hypothetical protein [unclassified Mesorhizobium]|uniref:hypothetical protein n=1 Tax=unclassified Mesorhizobium TaxID=325217 RepID=UPI0015E2CA00|nr:MULTISPECIES: hypothetical protein [unclassified Mesorhizobium]UCI25715.1 hypothetical protein FJ430_29855 [Mesorhizobium sp. B2-8-5]